MSGLTKLRNDCLEEAGCGPSTHDIIPTIGGRVKRQRRGVVGHIFRVDRANDVRIGNCPGVELFDGDIVLCHYHSGDCFQHYVILQEVEGGYIEIDNRISKFGAYESFDAMTDIGDRYTSGNTVKLTEGA